jgi:hypothetical protein
VLLSLVTVPSWAQSLTAGSLRGAVKTPSGEPVPEAQVTLESIESGRTWLLESNRQGQFSVTLLAPGNYRVLVEQIGFQPVRRLGIRVSAASATSVTIILERRPPPITTVTELDRPSLSAGTALGPV